MTAAEVLKGIAWELVRVVYWLYDLPDRLRHRHDRPPWEEW